MGVVALPSDLLARLDRPANVFRTAGGAGLAYDIRGAPDGAPCFWFHGSPSCRLEAVLLDDFGRTHGHCFIASDRPGIGRSSPQSGWSMTEYADQVVALADYLGLTQFSIAGGSGGGPFVLAVAARAPDRIRRAVSLACAGAFEIDALRAHIGWVDRLAAWAVKQPGLLPAFFAATSAAAQIPESVAMAAASPFVSRQPGGDKKLAALLVRSFREATQGGLAGVIEDTRVLHSAWGFELSSIRVPVDFVNGTDDEFVPWAYGAELAERVPGCRLHTAQGATHFTTIFDADRLRALLA